MRNTIPCIQFDPHSITDGRLVNQSFTASVFVFFSRMVPGNGHSVPVTTDLSDVNTDNFILKVSIAAPFIYLLLTSIQVHAHSSSYAEILGSVIQFLQGRGRPVSSMFQCIILTLRLRQIIILHHVRLLDAWHLYMQHMSVVRILGMDTKIALITYIYKRFFIIIILIAISHAIYPLSHWQNLSFLHQHLYSCRYISN